MKSYTGALGLAMVATALAADSVGAQSFEHSAWDEVLQRYAHDSRVDYGALKADRDLLDRYLAQVAAVRVDEFASWPETEQIAYLINAYNAYTIETVIDNYPIVILATRQAGFYAATTNVSRNRQPLADDVETYHVIRNDTRLVKSFFLTATLAIVETV